MELASRQFGRISHAQLLGCGLTKTTIARQVENGRLHRVLRGVYAVGHLAPSREGELAGAVLFAGPGAALSHVAGAVWRGFSLPEPTVIDISAPGKRGSIPGIRIRHPRAIEREMFQGLPVVPVPQLLLGVASQVPASRLRKMLADAEYRRLTTLEEVEAVLGRGYPGSAALREAMETHRPELARTLSELEERFLILCERAALPVPEVNATIEGLMVDAVWRDARVIVELDGHRAHADPVATERDRRRELILRAAGFLILRYTWRQTTREPQVVVMDLTAALGVS